MRCSTVLRHFSPMTESSARPASAHDELIPRGASGHADDRIDPEAIRPLQNYSGWT